MVLLDNHAWGWNGHDSDPVIVLVCLSIDCLKNTPFYCEYLSPFSHQLTPYSTTYHHIMSSKPTFLLVPGAWHSTAYFDPLIAYLSEHGYSSLAVTLPAVNSSPAMTSLQPDVDAVAAALAALLNDGSDVVVMMHSYGGMVGTDAVGKVVKERASADGSEGNKSAKIRRLVYVAAHVPLEGQSLFDAVEGVTDAPPFSLDHLIFEVTKN